MATQAVALITPKLIAVPQLITQPSEIHGCGLFADNDIGALSLIC